MRGAQERAPSTHCLLGVVRFFCGFSRGVLALAAQDGPLGVLTVIAGLVAAGSWALYQKREKYRKLPPHETDPYAALGCTRCAERALRRQIARRHFMRQPPCLSRESKPPVVCHGPQWRFVRLAPCALKNHGIFRWLKWYKFSASCPVEESVGIPVETGFRTTCHNFR